MTAEQAESQARHPKAELRSLPAQRPVDSALLVVGCAVSVGAAADACAAIPALRAGHIVAAARGLGDGAAGDVNGDNALLAVVFGVTAAAADACAAVFATRGLGDGAALDDDVGLAGRVFAAADAGAAISALRFDFGSAADDDIGVAGFWGGQAICSPLFCKESA